MTPAGRDRQLEQWLEAQGGRTASAPNAGACLDAERAAAWLDGQLGPEELLTAQTHAAGCGQCQLLLRMLMEAELAAEVPAPATGADRLQHGRATVGWWQGWQAWGAPLVAAAAVVLAVGLWLRVPTPSSTAVSTGRAAVDAVAGTAQQAAAPPLQGADANTQAQARPDGPAAANAPARSAVAEAPPLATGATAKQAAAEQRATVDAPTPPSENRIIGGVVGSVSGGIVAGFAGAAEQPASAAAPAPPPPPPAPAAAPPAPAAAVAAGAALRERAAADASPVPSFDVRAGAGKDRWRVAGSRVQRSRDEGTTWADVPAPAGTSLLAASAPASGVCWLVGRGGVVLVFAEPQGVTRVPFPENVDLVGVTATSAREARVDAADGRRFVTRDTGITWQLDR
ncbi:MAG: hypothetical protein U0Q55_03040 [Vicinamibacterales bacterium]